MFDTETIFYFLTVKNHLPGIQLTYDPSLTYIRWSVRHMLTEFLMVAILVYLQLSDHYAGVWSMSAAIISLIGKRSPDSNILPILHDSEIYLPNICYLILSSL